MEEFEIKAYREAVNEARRFIAKANSAIKRIQEDKHARYCCKEIAATKRSSMDLTRVLVKVRNPK